MEWIIWVIVIVLIIAIVWWLLNRNSRGTAADAARNEQLASPTRTTSAGSTRTEGVPPAAAGTAGPPSDITRTIPETGRLAEPDAGPAAAEAAPLASRPSPAAARPEPEDVEPDIESWEAATARPSTSSAGGDVDDWDDDGDKAEWDAQWSDAGSSTQTGAPRAAQPATEERAAPTHHAEYTDPHAPTLPGAESAAAESLDAEAETQQRIESSAATEAGASHQAQPRQEAHPRHEPQPHHLEQGFGSERGFGEQPIHRERVAPVSAPTAGAEPYGEGSAAPAADGSAPEGYAVKGDVSAMTYYDEDSSGYEDAKAEVWFQSVAHAEAAGFRAPRRTRR